MVKELKKLFPKITVLKADFSKIDDEFNLPTNEPFYYSEFASKDKKDGEWIVFNHEANLKQ